MLTLSKHKASALEAAIVKYFKWRKLIWELACALMSLLTYCTWIHDATSCMKITKQISRTFFSFEKLNNFCSDVEIFSNSKYKKWQENCCILPSITFRIIFTDYRMLSNSDNIIFDCLDLRSVCRFPKESTEFMFNHDISHSPHRPTHMENYKS